ncbi:MAG TPA: tRNA pseudouridine(38-40) synthase TruA [Candidatus Sulfotelmatobacter sp.]|nr:tRNA pseudouridine(38-40) synthase TruA [Candidatus Sulfotelmatobacter sp.]
MPRFRLTLEYDGTPFVGWQRQDNGRSVQAALEDAVARFSGETVTAVAAGRTDAGVHACGQVAHIDLAKPWEPFRVAEALNHHLKPEPIAVLGAALAPADFHARFSATERRYRYRIVNRRAPLTLARDRAWQVNQPLDAAAMHAAAQRLIGKHDFSTFRASLCQAASPVKTLARLAVARDGDDVMIDGAAPSFLHHQVRNIVGTLLLVGLGKWHADDVTEALEARDRARGGETAPAHGLYLMGVRYDAKPPADAR